MAAAAAVGPSSRRARRGAPAAIASEAGTKVFVGNLAFDVSWQDLKDHFRQAGEVIHADIMAAPGRSRAVGW